jgi:hypothetical protein
VVKKSGATLDWLIAVTTRLHSGHQWIYIHYWKKVFQEIKKRVH